ncbi:putative serine/threonine protein kinase [Trichoderma barbatum]
MPRQDQEQAIAQQIAPGANASSQPSSGSTTQVEPHVAVTTDAVAITEASLTAEESAQPFKCSKTTDSSFETAEIEARVSNIAALLAAREELELETNYPEPPTVDQVIELFNNASPSLPDARLIVASPQYPKDMGGDSSIVPLSHTAKNRVAFGVLQTAHNVDFPIKLPINNYSTIFELVYQIFFDPATDDCLLRNETCLPVYLTCLSTSSAPRAYIFGKSSRIIQPGVWRISMEGNECDTAERHLAEFKLLKRRFTVKIHRAIDATSAKRAANHDGEEHGTKRQRLEKEKNARKIVATPSINRIQTDIESELVIANTDNDYKVSSSVREIVNKAAVPLLDLTDNETAVVEPLKASSASPQQTSAVKGPAGYKLQRIKFVGGTRSTSVFSCYHSAVRGPVVAKVLRSESVRSVYNHARLWKQEKKVLENLNHRNIVELKAFDGRMLALYLERLPSSLSRGSKPKFTRSDACTILFDTSSGLQYLASQSIIHNDIKPLNITYSPERGAALIDFGMATIDGHSSGGGTTFYFPPEYLHEMRRGFSGDVWALGITMLYVLGKIELPDTSGRGWQMQDVFIEKGVSNTRMEEWLGYIARRRANLNQEDEIERIVFDMLEPNPEFRIKADSITAALDALRLDSADD